MIRFCRFIFSASVFAALVTNVSADVVHTSDGSRFVGIIEQIADGKLVIITNLVGRLEIDADMVTNVETDHPVFVQFKSGDRLVGDIELAEATNTAVIHTGIGDIPISSDKIAMLWPEGVDSPEIVAIRKHEAAEREALRPKWTATLEAGGTFTEGNTETFEARGRFNVARRTKDELLTFFLSADYYEQSKLRTKNEYRGGIRYESSVDDQRYWYTRLELEFDEFESLDLRSTAAVGGGRYWIKRDDRELKGSVGLGYRHEAFKTGLTTNSAVIDLGIDFRTELSTWAQFTHSTSYSPDFQDFDDYRVDFDSGIIFPLQNDGIKLRLGMRNEYNSRPLRNIKRLDNTFYANVVWTLK